MVLAKGNAIKFEDDRLQERILVAAICLQPFPMICTIKIMTLCKLILDMVKTTSKKLMKAFWKTSEHQLIDCIPFRASACS